MTKITKEKLLISIDVGTTKICVMVAHRVNQNQLNILGIGKAPSLGLQKGVVVNVSKTVNSIKQAMKEAEIASGVRITHAAIGISGGHIRAINSEGIVAVKKGQIHTSDINCVLEAAKAISVPEGYQILHALPQHFVLDGQILHDPLGMFGMRLEVKAHIILGAITSVQNLITCCQEAGVKVDDIVLEPIASAHAVLSKDERELGVAILDIGGGTADFVVYQNNSIVHSMVLPIAGNHFTNDIAISLRTTLNDAERVKMAHGAVQARQDESLVEIELAEGNKTTAVSKKVIGLILHARAQELLHFVRKEIDEKQLRPYCTSGLVITGGGSLLQGIDILAQTICAMPVRIGKLHAGHMLDVTLDHPMYATGYGLLLYKLHAKNPALTNYDDDNTLVQRVTTRMKSWINNFF